MDQLLALNKYEGVDSERQSNEERFMKLEESRSKYSAILGSLNARRELKELAERVAYKLEKEIAAGHFSFILLPLIIALIKDLGLDPFLNLMYGVLIGLWGTSVGVSTIPIIGWLIGAVPTAVLTTLIAAWPIIQWALSLLFSAILYIFLWQRGFFFKIKARFFYIILYIFLALLDGAPVISFLPSQTFFVLFAWRDIRKKAKKAKEKLPEIKTLTEKELKEIDEDIATLDNA